MSFEIRKQAAMQELKASGIWKSNSMPPALIILWKLGIKAKPPHYKRFMQNALPLGVWFAVVWGLLMWFLQWRHQGFPVSAAIVTALVGGVFFGVFMAAYYRWSARKHQLSDWVDLPVQDGQSYSQAG
ncbi:hypothetical protein CWE12_03125 [Aliidiomarina sedimenti]|uniref:DUF2628 domain-containing protein n=1 Tax=Aliidiomarina sedimenti TaxID=1933879 RepID=A0ABY0C330_9GAMM|nr:DUF6404 family protein [Aliidiomarina sedimenti]RUO31997.1 hypothetical protein CWE12_03125 [Aliidiomarina sedimenti]